MTMKITKLTLILTAVLTLSVITTKAEDQVGYTDQNYPVLKTKQFIEGLVQNRKECFLAQELVLDVGPTYTVPSKDWNKSGDWGIQGQIIYFPVREVGMGIQTGMTDSQNISPTIIDYLDVLAALRLPMDDIPFFKDTYFGEHVAPQVEIAPGFDWQHGAFECKFQGGIVYRITSRLGLKFEYEAKFTEGTQLDKYANDDRRAVGAIELAF